MYDVVGCDCMYVELKLFMRYPTPGKYVPITLEDDESLSAMWLSVTQMSAMVMEVYIEKVPKEIISKLMWVIFPGWTRKDALIRMRKEHLGKSVFHANINSYHYIH